MAKKGSVNRYGVREGDIFVYHSVGELGYVEFYQVTALRGATQVKVREIQYVNVATDGNNMQVLPVLDSTVWGKEEMIKKVQAFSDNGCYIGLGSGWTSFATLYERNRIYLEAAPPALITMFDHCDKSILRGLNLREGYGIYAAYGPFNWPIGDNERVVLRRPGMEDEETYFGNLFQKPFRNSLAEYIKENFSEEERKSGNIVVLP